MLLSIGYAACHWCHVMEHESFEDEETARLMNERFVSVKVDREERPDVDGLYMEAVLALAGHGGWPMTVFLDPDGRPFFGGTYYPPEPRHGLPSFRQVLGAVADAYRDRRGDLDRQAGLLTDAIREAARVPPSTEPLTSGLLSGAVSTLGASLRSRARRLRRGAEVPARLDARVPVPPGLGRGARHGEADARPHGRGRHVRPRRRRLSPLLGGRRLARPPLREDALRQRAAGHGLPARLGRDRRGALPPRRRGDARLPGARAAPAGGRIRVLPGRGHRRRRGHDLHVDGRGDRGGPRRAASRLAAPVRARTLDPPRHDSRGRPRQAARGPRRAAAAGARRQGARRVERPRARRVRGGGAPVRPRGLPRRGARRSPGSCSGRCPRTANSCGASATAWRRSTRTWRTTPAWRTACSSCTRRPASFASSRRGAGSRSSRSIGSRIRCTAASS